MAPVLTSNYDYDYDTLQPYFLPEEEDFYPTDGRHLVPGPGKDMWKKFELLPTPPRSPRRTPSLQTMCDVLDQDCNPSTAFTSYIIQDCMWSSSFAAAAKLDQVVSERLASLRARRESSASTDTHQDSSSSHDREERDLPAAACIDPCVVLPGNTLNQKPISCETNTEELVCLDSSALSSSGSETDEDEDEEDLDVDVVSIDRRKFPPPPDSQIKSFSPSPLVLKRSHIDIHQHNYAAATPHPSRHTHSPRKQTKTEGILSSSSAVSSKAHGNDSDTDKRKIHNVLERQRRSELKMSFVELRDQIPDVKNNGKVAKVVILKKATEFIKQMKEEERDLIEMKERMRKRRRKLEHRLKQLRTPL